MNYLPPSPLMQRILQRLAHDQAREAHQRYLAACRVTVVRDRSINGKARRRARKAAR